MKLQSFPNSHLTYCLNIHAGESWEENLQAIRNKTLLVRDEVAEDNPFGLGMRLSAAAAETLAREHALEEFRSFLEQENLYVFTINGFPYGRFHGSSVKENVYFPDWRSKERLNYTIRLADILAELLPPNIEGSISTVPGSFKSWIRSSEDIVSMVANLAELVVHLNSIFETSGKVIHVGLEPEPSCFVETTDELISFFSDYVLPKGGSILSEVLKMPQPSCEKLLRRHLGVCLDTCHTAIQFEDIATAAKRYDEAGIRISKCQLSAALAGTAGEADLVALADFDEPVYLHQVKARRASGEICGWDDLGPALSAFVSDKDFEEVRIHFHVPIFLRQFKALGSTVATLCPEALELVASTGCRHFEIETYTFEILPEELRQEGVIASIVREFVAARSLFGIEPV